MLKASAYLAAAFAACSLLCASSAMASRPSLAECFEGSDFIADAALSRDAGLSAEAFLGRMEQDFEVIQTLPAELRWFVHDADDEAFLLSAAREVFAYPRAAPIHRRLFLQACVERMAG
jgi:hypothetical protein